MDRRSHPDARAQLAELELRIAEQGDPTGALTQERLALLAELAVWRAVGRRASDKLSRPTVDKPC